MNYATLGTTVVTMNLDENLCVERRKAERCEEWSL